MPEGPSRLNKDLVLSMNASFEELQQDPPFSPEGQGQGRRVRDGEGVQHAVSENALLASSLAAQELPEATLEMYRKASRQHELDRLRERLQAPLDKRSRGA